MGSLWDRYQKNLLRDEVEQGITSGDFLHGFLRETRLALTGEDPEAVFHALTHLTANDSRIKKQSGETAAADTFLLT